jgi:hypothetical protein
MEQQDERRENDGGENDAPGSCGADFRHDLHFRAQDRTTTKRGRRKHDREAET